MKPANMFAPFLAVLGLLSVIIVTLPHAHGQTSIVTDGDIVGDGVSLWDLESSYCEHLENLHAGTALPTFCVLPGGTWYVFVTSASSTSGGNLVQWANDLVAPGTPFTSGLLAADAICQYHADNAPTPLPGTYKAWLSREGALGVIVAAKNRIGDHRWVLTDTTTIVADDLADLLNCTNPNCLQSPINLTEAMTPVVTYVYTGTRENGTGTGLGCNAWTSNDAALRHYTQGINTTLNHDWTFWYEYPTSNHCGTSARLYCFGD